MRLAKLVPAPIRTKVKSAMRDMAINAALEPLKATGTMTDAQIMVLLKAWGDDGFSADPSYISRMLKLMNTGPVFECGSGATTLIENELGRRHGFKIFALEQDAGYAKWMADREFEAATVIHAPLKQAQDYVWYDFAESLPMHFPLVICDGPYVDKSLGEQIYSGWRYGVMPWLKKTGRTFDTMLLDDVISHEKAAGVLERWKREFGVKVEVFDTGRDGWAIVRP